MSLAERDLDTVVEPDRPHRPDVLALLDEHLTEMRATSPAESVHALDPDALAAPGITFWTARRADALLGCVALKDLGAGHGELKSMRTAFSARRQGVAATMLTHVIEHARARGMRQMSLETGSQDHFAPARRLYRAHGFVDCGPFADYVLDSNSVFLTLAL